uniref:Retrotransposon gag domain-containing protein n=1 Tax=Fagus sylvatica TaxID=28930 RepID=A0A2N9G4W6_FAGSY
MAEERGAQPEAPRMTMYQLLHPTQSSIPSCIMFPPNAPHVEIKQGLMAILPDFRGLENENPYVHVRAFEVMIGSFYAQNVIETAKLRFFPFSLKDKAKGWLYTLKPREKDNMNAKISLLTKEIEILKLKGSKGVNVIYREDPMEACQICQEIDHTTSAYCLWRNVLYTFIQKQGEQNQRFDTMFTRIDEEMRETKSQVARLTEALSRTERGKLPSQTQPNPNNQTGKVVNTDKFEKVKSITILRSGKEIGKDVPKANEKSKETPAEKDESGIAKSNDIEKCPFLTPFPQALKLPKNLDVTSEILEHLHQVKVNLPLLHLIKQMPPMPRNGRMKITFGSMTAELNIFNVNPQQILEEEQVIEAKNPPRSKKKSFTCIFRCTKAKVKENTKRMKSARGSNYSFGGSRSGG